MDGTLTIGNLDFPAIKQSLGLPVDRGILEVLEEMPREEAERIHRAVDEIEGEKAAEARVAPGAHDLLHHLAEGGCHLGIVTRNRKAHALVTLAATGLLPFFEERCILGREEASPKPSPEGLELLLAMWQADPRSGVMVGDYLFDLQAGRAAGIATIYVDPSRTFSFGNHADLKVGQLHEVITLMAQS